MKNINDMVEEQAIEKLAQRRAWEAYINTQKPINPSEGLFSGTLDFLCTLFGLAPLWALLYIIFVGF